MTEVENNKPMSVCNLTPVAESELVPVCLPSSTTSSVDPGKVDWKSFLDMFQESRRTRDGSNQFPPLESAEDVPDEEVDALLAHETVGIRKLLDRCRDAEDRREIARAFLEKFPAPESEWVSAGILMTAEPDVTYWVAGDIHAKVSSIAKICAVIADRKDRGLTRERNRLILLGDYIDRGDEPLETLAFIEALRLRPLFKGFDVKTLKGNHDVGFTRNEADDYVSVVSPAETADFFRSRRKAGEDLSVEAEAAMRLAAVSPRMCELTGIDADDPSKTMLFVHGGVPHVDLHEKLHGLRQGISQKEPFFQALSGATVPEEVRRQCAEDFTWVRFSKDLPEKVPNRGSRGCEIGTENVAQYLYLHRLLTTRNVTCVFRGHDHERAGFACYSYHADLNPTKKKYAQRDCHVLTLNAMEPDFSSRGLFLERDIALAEWTLGGPVRLTKIVTRHLEPPALVTVQEAEAIPEAGGKPAPEPTVGSVVSPERREPPLPNVEALFSTNAESASLPIETKEEK